MGAAKDIGDWGEDIAARYLRGNGFTILERNWRKGRYELDIIATRGGVLHFVEVKCRSVDSYERPEEAISYHKFRSLSRAAAAYIAINKVDSELQFDLIAVDHGPDGYQVRYVPEAMVPRW